MADLKRAVKKLVQEFKEADAWAKSEEDVQASFTLALLRKLGWGPANWQVNTGTTSKPADKPDIVLKDDAGFSVLVIESKAPRHELGLKTQKEQVFRYAAYEGKYWGILTNFVEWRVYATYPPCIYKKFAFHDLLRDPYLKKEYVDLTAPEGLEFLAFLKREPLCAKHGRFDEAEVYYPPQEKIRDEFFNRLREWRKKLRAELYKKYGKRYGKDDVDLGTQKILDRLIFIEVCTDKEILAGDVLASVLTADGRFYRVLKSQFERMDELFNTELFANHWIDGADIPDKIIEPIIRGVAEVDFERLPVHVIGEVYEDYLGELLREKGRGVSGKKTKATRKAKGIYYTPEYIVDYIVTNTVGELLKKAKSEEDIKKLRVLDPACGSGSFLIRAFDEFAAAYERVLNKKGTATLFGFDVKRSILENNLYGVDIDARAVEITKLNLMIKALEETKYQDLKGRKLLPNLRLNIRCGNSLVSGEETGDKEGQLAIFGAEHEAEAEKLIALREKFYAARDDDEKEGLLERVSDTEYDVNEVLNARLSEYFDDPREVKPFNYSVAFPEVFRAGGFDAVIGNPPYIFTRELITTSERGYFVDKYKTTYEKSNTYMLFMDKMIRILRKRGKGGYIVPNSWLTVESAGLLRGLFIPRLVIIADLNYRVFKNVSMEPSVFIISGDQNPEDVLVLKANSRNGFLKANLKRMNRKNWSDSFGRIVLSDSVAIEKILKKVIKTSVNLEEAEFIVRTGLQAYERGKGNPPQTPEDVKNHIFDRDTREDENSYRYLKGRDVKRYSLDWSGQWLQYGPWLSQPREIDIFRRPRLLIREITAVFPRCFYACLVFEDFLNNKSVLNVLHKNDDKFELKKLLAILNSTLTSMYYKARAVKSSRKLFPKIVIRNLREFPFPKVITESSSKLIVKLVDAMLDLNATEESRKTNAAAIDATDRKIDALVYLLYGLTPEEIKIVEGS